MENTIGKFVSFVIGFIFLMIKIILLTPLIILFIFSLTGLLLMEKEKTIDVLHKYLSNVKLNNEKTKE